MIQAISPVSFTGQVDLRRLWLKGKLPTVKYGFYGDELTAKTVTREHLLPASKGGTRAQDNIVLASQKKNGARGNDDINKYAENSVVRQYLGQFIDVKVGDFRGNQYIRGIIDRLKTLGFKL